MLDRQACTPDGDGYRQKTTGLNTDNAANAECMISTEGPEWETTIIIW